MGEYLQTWKLKLSTIKTVSAAFHLNNKEAKRELKVSYNNEILPFCSEPKYLGVTLDRSLPQCSHPLYWPRHQWRLADCDWMPVSYTSGQPSDPRRHPTCWASSQWSHTVSSTPCHGAWTPAPLSAHLSIECKCTAPQIETPIWTRCTATHQLIWQQHTCGSLGGSPMECGVGGQAYKTPHFHPRHRHTPFRNDPPKKSLGPA